MRGYLRQGVVLFEIGLFLPNRALNELLHGFSEFGEKSMIWSILYYIYSYETPKTTHFAES